MMYQPIVEVEKNRSEKSIVFKAVSGNVVKWMEMRPETRVITRARKTIKAFTQQMATKELMMEKSQIEVWKDKVMGELAHKLHSMNLV